MDRTDPFWPSMRTKSLSPPGRHPLGPLWNDTDGSLRREIIESLVNVEWHVIDILRLGYDRIDGEDPGHWSHPITLLVSVEPATVAWEEGHAAVLRCKAILERHGINDVPCEMKESRICPAVSSEQPAGPQLGLPPALASPIVQAHAQAIISDCTGVAIGVGSLAGTKGLYFRRNGLADHDSNILALTCRHVVFAQKEDDQKEYRFDPTKPKVSVMQPDERTLGTHKGLVKGAVEILKDDIKTLKEQAMHQGFTEDPRIEGSTGLLNSLISQQQDYEKLLKELASFDSELSRTIGHVWFAPAYGYRQLDYPVHPDQPHQNRHFRDWALFELDPRKHQRPLDEIANRVFVGDGWRIKVKYALQKAQRFRGLVQHGTTLALRGIIPVEEVYNPPLENDENDPVIAVAKVGRSSGLTIGFGSMYKSVKREILDGQTQYTEEWCITGVRLFKDQVGISPFSAKGDSGACVFDLQGRIGGLVTGGASGNDKTLDTTYVAPIEWILKSMEENGLNLSIV